MLEQVASTFFIALNDNNIVVLFGQLLSGMIAELASANDEDFHVAPLL